MHFKLKDKNGNIIGPAINADHKLILIMVEKSRSRFCSFPSIQEHVIKKELSLKQLLYCLKDNPVILLYLFSCSNIFSSTVTASALVAWALGLNWFELDPTIRLSLFNSATAPFAHDGMLLSSAKLVTVSDSMFSLSAFAIITAISERVTFAFGRKVPSL